MKNNMDYGKKLRNKSQWLVVLKLRRSGMSMPVIGAMLGLSRQRVFQILNLAKKHAERWDDDLAKQIKVLVQ